MTKFSISFIALLFVSAITLRGVSAQQLIIEEVIPQKMGIIPKKAEENLIQRRYVRIDTSAIRDLFSVAPFKGDNFKLRKQWTENQAGMKNTVFELDGGSRGSFSIIAQKDDLIYVKLVDGNRTIFLEYSNVLDIYEVTEYDFTNVTEGEGDAIRPPLGLLPDEQKEQLTKTASCLVSFPACTTTNIDIMVLYTPAAKTYLGGMAQAELKIGVAVTEMNTANSSSGLSNAHTFTLRHKGEVNYTESTDQQETLSRLSFKSGLDYPCTYPVAECYYGGYYMDEIHQLRTDTGSDVVSLITGNGCGVAWRPSPSYSSLFGFSVVSASCMLGNYSLAHEVAHNLGMDHNWDEPNSGGSTSIPCDYFRGHINPGVTGDRWRTIMSYTDGCNDCVRILRWSNSSLTYNPPYNNPLGILYSLPPASEPSETALGIDETFCVVKDYMAAVLPIELVSFSAILEDGEIVLKWVTASEQDNLGFEIHELDSESRETTSVLGFVDGHGTTLESQVYEYRTGITLPGNYAFKLQQLDGIGTFSTSPDVTISITLDEPYLMGSAYPNPFNPQSTFYLSVAQDQEVNIQLFDIQGRLMQNIYKGNLSANQTHYFTVDGSELASGTYFYRVAGENFLEAKQIQLVK